MTPRTREFPEPRSAYVHVPFCAHHCGYCDFTVIAGRNDLICSYLRALELELETLDHSRTLDTLYIGGGTPTHLPAEQLTDLLNLLGAWFQLAESYEHTVEANPHGFTLEKMKALARAGINRVSLGAQSFDDGVLKLLERDHKGADIPRVVGELHPLIGNISVDLIFGVPRQTPASWRETLQRAIDLDVMHISTYGLTFEKGTRFWNRLQKGHLVKADPELEREMYATAMSELEAAGFEQYEISNFARPGCRSLHNEIYWKGLPYFAFGPGAARYIQGRREMNHRSVVTWMRRIMAGQSPVMECEQLSDEDRAREALVIGLRRCEGIEKDAFHAQTGFDVDDLAGGTIERHCHNGLLDDCGSHIRLTREGRFLADTVFVDLL